MRTWPAPGAFGRRLLPLAILLGTLGIVSAVLAPLKFGREGNNIGADKHAAARVPPPPTATKGEFEATYIPEGFTAGDPFVYDVELPEAFVAEPPEEFEPTFDPARKVHGQHFTSEATAQAFMVLVIQGPPVMDLSDELAEGWLQEPATLEDGTPAVLLSVGSGAASHQVVFARGIFTVKVHGRSLGVDEVIAIASGLEVA